MPCIQNQDSPPVSGSPSSTRRSAVLLVGSFAAVMILHVLGRYGHYLGLYSFVVADCITLGALVLLCLAAAYVLQRGSKVRVLSAAMFAATVLIGFGQALNVLDGVHVFGGTAIPLERTYLFLKEPILVFGILLFIGTLFGSILALQRGKESLELEMEERRRAENALKQAHDELERRVAERTAELASANETLREEIEERSQLEEQYREAQKLEAVGQLAGGIAHDFNNVLQIILAATEVSANPKNAPKVISAAQDQIRKAVERGGTMVRQLLAFSRRGATTLEPIDLDHVVREAVALLKHLMGPNIELKTAFQPQHSVILADRVQIEQILLNLCANARDAMPDGGTIWVRTESCSLEGQDSASYPMLPRSDYTVLTVSDSGQGIPPELREHIFEPFFTTKEVGKGTGLGLASVYGIVQRHNGFIEVDSKPGGGTTFHILFPKTDAAPDEVLAVADLPAQQGQGTILLCEDEVDLAALVAAMLENAGYCVLIAYNGDQASQYIEEQAQDINVFIFDMVLPGKSGRVLYEELRAIKPDAKVLFSTGYTIDEVPRAEFAPDAPVVIQKPYLSRRLLVEIRRLLSDNSPVSSPKSPI
jgi:signal transduction histidine kinase